MLGDIVRSEYIAVHMQKMAANLDARIKQQYQTYKDFCEVSGISKGALSLYVRGKVIPRADSMYRIITHLNCTEDDLCDTLDLPDLALSTDFYRNLNLLTNVSLDSLRTLSAQIGLSHSEIAKYKNKSAIPRLDSLLLLSNYFYLSIRSLSGNWDKHINGDTGGLL